jgi:benzoate-CoA ligase family protein
MNAAEVLPAEFNAATHFVDRNLAEGRGDRLAYLVNPFAAASGGERALRYRDLAELANRTGNALRELGVDLEDRVLMVCLDAPEFLGTFWGAIKIGAVPVPVNTLMRRRDYEYFLNDSRAKAVVFSAPLLAEVAPALCRAPRLRHALIAGGNAPGCLSYEVLVERGSSTLEPAQTSRDDVAFWLYSSGSTGFPKGVVHLQHDMLVAAECYARHVLALTANDRIYSAAKLFFGYGLGNSGYFPLNVGAETVLDPERPTAERVFEILSRHRPTIFFGVPTLYAGMLALADAGNRYDLSSLRLCVSAGEPLPAEIYRRWLDRFGVEILDGIGTTEILHIFLSNRPGAARPGSSGVPVPGYGVAIVDEQGVPAGPGTIGNLRVKGDSTMAFYWNKHEQTKNTLRGQWIETGDKYYRDEDGYYWYCGRSDDMLKVGGIWVSPAEVEGALIEHPAVLESAVVGRDDGDGLLKPQAFVVLKERTLASPALAEELKGLVKSRLAPYKYPRWIDFVDELPKTATGKIQRFKLRRRSPEERSL